MLRVSLEIYGGEIHITEADQQKYKDLQNAGAFPEGVIISSIALHCRRPENGIWKNVVSLLNLLPGLLTGCAKQN